MKKAKKICCSSDQVKKEVKKHYGNLITGKRSSCCGPSTIEEGMNPAPYLVRGEGRVAKLAVYGEEERSQVPEEVYLSSFGCGNPVAYAEVKPGEVVLDLGSGAGLDALLASKSYLWSSCVGGALDEKSYLQTIREAGFKEVKIVDRLDYDRETIRGLMGSGCLDLPEEVRKKINQPRREWEAKISSIKVSAKKKATIKH